jgi:thiol-disulfide isomerase/thioredoxin
VLLDLWASWCSPCRKKHPELVEIYKKYSKENFTILGIALEEKDDRAKWLTAISKDKLLWTQVTDFKSWNNAVAKEFGVRSIPFNLLVDPDGKIIDKNLSGADLDNRLAELFKNK